MRVRGVVTLAAVAAIAGGFALTARAEMNTSGPANLPPDNYSGRQFVDSKGCVFVRAGYAGSAGWFPRIDRQRNQLCGYQPTDFGVAPARAESPAPAPKAAPVQSAAPAPAPTAAPVQPVPVRSASPARSGRAASPFEAVPGAGKPMETIATTSKPPRVAAVSPQPAVTPVMITAAETVAGTTTTCPNAPAVAQRYTLSDGRRVVRCAADTSDPVGFINQAHIPGITVTGMQIEPAPSPVPTPVMAAVAPAQPPAAAAVASGEMTPQQAYAAASPYQVAPAGQAPSMSPAAAAPRGPVAMAAPYAPPKAAALADQTPLRVPDTADLRLSNGLRTLAPVQVGTDAGTAGYKPAYADGRLNPYRGPRTDAGQADQAQLWTNEVPSRLVTTETPARKHTALAVAPAQTLPGAQPQVRASTMTAPAYARAGGYVQVGAYAQPSNARSAQARLAALGMPVSSARVTRGGRPLTMVLVGPFAAGQVAGALSAVRRAGFQDAILR